MKGPGHKGVVLGGVGEDDELGAADAVAVTGEIGSLLDDLAHLAHRVHVDAGFCGGDVDRRADEIRHRQSLGD